MKLTKSLLVALCVLTLLMGCSKSTTVILPPETTGHVTEAPTTASTTAPTDNPTTESTDAPTAPSTEPTTVPTTPPTTEPVTEPATDSTTPPTTKPSTEPTTTPTVPPTTEPVTEPTTTPTVPPTTEPVTEPTTAPTTPPTTEPATEPTTAPTVPPTTEPITEPATEPVRHPVYDLSNHSVGATEYNLLNAINQKRADQELPPLTLDATLCALGTIRAYECTENFSHVRPDGRPGISVLSDYGYAAADGLSERLHYGSSGLSTGTIIKGWMYNPDFSADILSADYSRIGIGVYEDGTLIYIVCFFAP